MLERRRLILRMMRPEDVDGLLKIFSDPKVMNSFGVDPFNRGRMEKWVWRNIIHQQKYGYGLFSVIHRDDHVLVGDCGLEHMEVEGRQEVELGYDFRSDYWGRGLATEAARREGLRPLHAAPAPHSEPDKTGQCRLTQGVGEDRDEEGRGNPARRQKIPRLFALAVESEVISAL
jgi:hypothetical protein